jgi:hypothetical protein
MHRHFRESRRLRHGARIDTIEVFRPTTQVVDMRPDNAGTWPTTWLAG